jgi:hypothetical protein
MLRNGLVAAVLEARPLFLTRLRIAVVAPVLAAVVFVR